MFYLVVASVARTLKAESPRLWASHLLPLRCCSGGGECDLTPRWSARMRDKVPSYTTAHSAFGSIVRPPLRRLSFVLLNIEAIVLVFPTILGVMFLVGGAGVVWEGLWNRFQIFD